MLPCRECQEYLPQYVADGEPATRATAPLRAHLQACPACASLLVRLRRVEGALYAYPQPSAPPALAARVLGEVTRAGPREPGEWRWLPWDVWVPVLALALAIVLATVSAPRQALVGGPVVDFSPTAEGWGATLEGWTRTLAPLPGADPMLVVWIGGSVAAAIAGVLIGLSAWRHADEASHDLLQLQVERISAWFGGLLSRTL